MIKQVKTYKKRLLFGATETKEYGHETPANKHHKQIRRLHA